MGVYQQPIPGFLWKLLSPVAFQQAMNTLQPWDTAFTPDSVRCSLTGIKTESNQQAKKGGLLDTLETEDPFTLMREFVEKATCSVYVS